MNLNKILHKYKRIRKNKMPRKPISYEKAVIYKIACKDLSVPDVYVGSTTNFIKRRYLHKFYSINDNTVCGHYLVYDKIKQNGGWDNWDMIELCKANDCTTAEELHKKEREYMEQLGASLNVFIPGRTMEEYREKNKEKLKAQYKEYYEENKERILQYHKEYYANNKEKKKASIDKKQVNKAYYEKNKETIKAKNAMTQKERYHNDDEFRDKIKECALKNYHEKKGVIDVNI